jgi:hypothetical protein
MAFFTEVVKVNWKIFWRRNFRIPVIGVIAVIDDWTYGVLWVLWPMRPMLTHEPLMCSLIDDAFEDWLCLLTVAAQQVV